MGDHDEARSRKLTKHVTDMFGEAFPKLRAKPNRFWLDLPEWNPHKDCSLRTFREYPPCIVDFESDWWGSVSAVCHLQLPISRVCQSALNRAPLSASNRDPIGSAVAGPWRRSFSACAADAGLRFSLIHARVLRRQLSLPVSTMSQWWVSRSNRAVVIFASPKTVCSRRWC